MFDSVASTVCFWLVAVIVIGSIFFRIWDALHADEKRKRDYDRRIKLVFEQIRRDTEKEQEMYRNLYKTIDTNHSVNRKD